MKHYRDGLIIVFSAPSGAGKSTLCRVLMDRLPGLKFSVSCTTRPRRAGERNGRDYFFVTEQAFKDMARRNAFVEWAVVHGHYYGTLHRELRGAMRAGKDVVLDIDVQGGMNIKKCYPGAVLIYIMTPSLSILEKRLRARKKDSEDVIRRRLANARRELKYLPRYDYLVINDRVERAADELETIITAEYHRLNRMKRLPSFGR